MEQLAALKPGSGILAAACDALGVSRATFHRRQVAAVRPPAVRSPRPTPGRALPEPERQRVIVLLREPQFVDLAPAEIVDYSRFSRPSVAHNKNCIFITALCRLGSVRFE